MKEEIIFHMHFPLTFILRLQSEKIFIAALILHEGPSNVCYVFDVENFLNRF